jgi:AP endonuclease 2
MLTGAPSTTRPVPLRVVTWNIGLRGLKNLVFDQHGGSLASVFALCGNPDILCLQETKTTKPELAKWAEALVRVPGIYGFFAFNRRGTGYSGVVTYCKTTAMPVSAGWFALLCTNGCTVSWMLYPLVV